MKKLGSVILSGLVLFSFWFTLRPIGNRMVTEAFKGTCHVTQTSPTIYVATEDLFGMEWYSNWDYSQEKALAGCEYYNFTPVRLK